jgi:hypothetical protein
MPTGEGVEIARDMIIYLKNRHAKQLTAAAS